MIPVLPFSAEVLDSLLGRYNLAVWPLPVLAPLLAVAAVVLAASQVRGGGRIAAALLAVAWAWVGIAYHVRTAGQIDFMAPVYGAFFVAQAALLAWYGALRGGPPAGLRRDARGWAGLVLVTAAIAGYPLAALIAGRAWPSLPIVGVAPDPTAMLTLGLLLLGTGPVRLRLLAIPALWSLVAGMTALSLQTPVRLVLPAAAVLALVVAVRSRRGTTA